MLDNKGNCNLSLKASNCVMAEFTCPGRRRTLAQPQELGHSASHAKEKKKKKLKKQ